MSISDHCHMTLGKHLVKKSWKLVQYDQSYGLWKGGELGVQKLKASEALSRRTVEGLWSALKFIGLTYANALSRPPPQKRTLIGFFTYNYANKR